jgi:predicted phage terminase large subunit-like protein
MAPGAKCSFNTIQMWYPVGLDFYLVDQWREQCDFAELRRRCLLYYKRHRPRVILVEKAANGHALVALMKPKIRKIVREIKPQGSKTSRLRRNITAILDRHILLPEGAPWRDEYVDEFVRFPHGDFTDQVDATTQFLDWIRTDPKWPVSEQPGLCAGVNSKGEPLLGGPPNGRFIQPTCWVVY